MFGFDMPKNAAIKVELPTGGSAVMVHTGGGHFVSSVPPLALAGISAVEGEQSINLPLAWESNALPADVHHALFAFDTAMAEKSLEAAAAAGDVRAKAVLDQVIAAEAQLQAQIAVGMVSAADPEVAADTQDAA